MMLSDALQTAATGIHSVAAVLTDGPATVLPPAGLNWLLSACAQTAGAIVAIVGGFLVSSIVSLDSRTKGLKAQQEGIRASLEEATTVLEIAERNLTEWEIEQFLRESLPKIISAGGNIQLEQLVEQHATRSQTLENISPRFHEVAQEVKEAMRILNVQALQDAGLGMGFEKYRTLAESNIPVSLQTAQSGALSTAT